MHFTQGGHDLNALLVVDREWFVHPIAAHFENPG